MTQKELEIKIAFDGHEGQVRRDGQPYIIHPLGVMSMMERDGFPEEPYHTAAVLHDSHEDTDWKIDRMRQVGIGERVLRIVEILSKSDDQTDEEYEQAIVSSYEASQIKVRDMQHNLNSSPKPHKVLQYLARLARIEKVWGFEYNSSLENTF